LRYGAYSMIVSKKGIQKILNYFDKNRFYTPYDIDIHFIPKINEYICNEEIVTHWWKTPYSDSTIPMKNKKK